MTTTRNYYSHQTLPFGPIIGTPGVKEIVSRRDGDPDEGGCAGFIWRIVLTNGRSLSVLHHERAACSTNSFEVAVLDSAGKLDYDTPLTGDVLTGVTPHELLIYVRWAASLRETGA